LNSSTDYSAILDAIFSDSRYQRNLDWGESRPGHPEGTVRAHIEELEQNLSVMAHKLTDAERAKLRLLIHTHDSFKAEARRGVSILDPQSHASIASSFLTEFCDDHDLAAMVQYHDEPYALWRQYDQKGSFNVARFDQLMQTIQDWDLFLAFNIIDGCTEGKGREPLAWFLEQISGKINARFTSADIL
jgi:hypothetical protein